MREAEKHYSSNAFLLSEDEVVSLWIKKSVYLTIYIGIIFYFCSGFISQTTLN